MKNFKVKTFSSYSTSEKNVDVEITKYLNSMKVDGIKILQADKNYQYRIITWEGGDKLLVENLSDKPRNGICECGDSMTGSDNVHCINCRGVIITK